MTPTSKAAQAMTDEQICSMAEKYEDFPLQSYASFDCIGFARELLAAQPSQAQAAEAVMTRGDRDTALAKWTREVEGAGIAVTSLMRSAYRDGWDDAAASPVSNNEREGLTEALELLNDAQSYVDAFADDKTDGHIAKSLSDRISVLLAARTGGSNE